MLYHQLKEGGTDFVSKENVQASAACRACSYSGWLAGMHQARAVELGVAGIFAASPFIQVS